MARHGVGGYRVEVLHRKDAGTGKVNVAVFVFLKGEYVEQAEFGFSGFNSAELRRRLRTLEKFSVQRLDAVIEDARCWPRGETKAKTPMKPKPRRLTRP